MAEKIHKTDEEWRKLLTPEQFEVARQKGTEPAFTGKYWDLHDEGLVPLRMLRQRAFQIRHQIRLRMRLAELLSPRLTRRMSKPPPTTAYGMRRTEVMCSRCGAHLGHVFEDGPRPTGLRYCMNSASLNFVKKARMSKTG